MDAHKATTFKAWEEAHLTPYEGSEVDKLQGHLPFVLGGKAVERQVRKLLVDQKREALLEWESSVERERGAEWWRRYMEGPADEGLMGSLKTGIPRRPKESTKTYETRLHRVEAMMRARLPSYSRPLSASEEEAL
jgi:hypothetical protein